MNVAAPSSLLSFAGAAPAPPPAGGPAQPQPRDQFSWSKALVLPGTVYTAAGGALSGLVAYAEQFPAGGIRINPGGIVRNPEWTRSFAEGSTLGRMQPILAGVTALVSLARGVADLREARATGSSRMEAAAALDFAIAAMSLTSIVSPGIGGAATLALGAARLAIDLHG